VVTQYDAAGLGRVGSPAQQIVERLTISKRHRVKNFDIVWSTALDRCLLPHEKEERQWWYLWLADPTCREWFRRAYFDEPGPDQALAVLADALDDQPDHVGPEVAMAHSAARVDLRHGRP